MNEIVGCSYCGDVMEVFAYDKGVHVAHCLACGLELPSRPTYRAALEAAAKFCVMDPRPRLPTEADDAAHRERHGPDAGWCGFVWDSVDKKWSPLRSFDRIDLRIYKGSKVRAWPHVDGRPVAWPEGVGDE